MTGRRGRFLPHLLVAGAALVLVVLAEARGARPWRGAAAAALAIGVLSFSRRAGDLSERDAGGSSAEHEAGLVTALDELASGDLVRSRSAAERLPFELRSATLSALAPLEVLALRLQKSSVEVAGAATGVKRISSELAAGSSEQAASVVEITAAMEELAQTASQIAANAETQAELARHGELSGDTGTAALARAVAGLERLRQRVDAIAARAADLENRATQVFGVLALVEDIARETHLLSLNAAIEAAGQPGDVGRRFQGVAEEVRQLAAHSREAAGSVRHLLEEFSVSIRATAEATAASGREADGVLAHVRETSAAIQGLREALRETAVAAGEISTGTGEQQRAAAEVVQTLREAASVVHRIAEDLRGFSTAARGLEAAAVDVQLLAQVFRLASPSSLRDLVERWAADLEPLLAAPDALERRLESLLEQRGDAECAYVYDPRRERVAIAAQPSLLAGHEIPESIRSGQGFADRPWYRAVLAERRTTVTPVFVSLLSGERVVTVVAPLALDGDRTIALGIDISLERWTAH